MLKDQLAAAGIRDKSALTTRLSLADLHSQRGQLNEAEEDFRAILSIREGQLGGKHSDTLRARANLAYLFAQRGQLERARREYRTILVTQQASLPAGHPDILGTEKALDALRRGKAGGGT